jgi:hypothetical protein
MVETAVFRTAGTAGNIIRSARRVMIKIKVKIENLQALIRRYSVINYHDLFLHDLEMNHDRQHL